VDHHAGDYIFCVGLHRAADHAGRFNAVVASHRKIVALGVRIIAAFHLAHASPVEFGRVAVLFIAGHHAALAANALRHIEVEAVLFAFSRRARRDELTR
jgi:hypothetical protein